MARRPSPAVLAFVLVAAACGSTGPTPVPPAASATVAPPSITPSAIATEAPTTSVAPSPSSGPGALKWSKFGQVENTGLRVPLDYANPSGGTITLAVARRPAGDPAHRIGTLFVNPGGPGGGGVELVSYFGLSSMIPQAVLDRFDVVSWDPRGVGLSQALVCPDQATVDKLASLDPDPRGAAALKTYRTVFDDLAVQCRATDPNLLPTMSEATTARDMDAIRAALGETTISYLGWSYGTYLGYLYATMFPTHLRAAVLDGPVDPVPDLTARDLSQGRGFDAALRHFLDLCAASTACAFHGGGNPVAAYDALMAKLPRTSSGSGLDLGHAVMGVGNWLYGTDLAGLATALASAERGDGSALRASADAYYQGVMIGAYEATTCLDVRHPTTEAGIAAAVAAARKAAPRFGAVITLTDLYGCLDWAVGPEPVPVAAPPAGLPTILVLAGRWDPATPPWEAAPLAKALGTGVVLMRDGVGHTSGESATTDACLRTALTAYLDELTPPKPGTVCKDAPVSFKP